jgi:hypothetical protein
MKAGLIYIVLIFLVLLTVSLNDTRNDQSQHDIQTCRSITSNTVISCTLPESVISLKKIPCVQIFSDIFHRSLFESRNPDRIKMPVQALMDYNRPSTFMALGQRVLLFLIYTKSSEDDHHLWNK